MRDYRKETLQWMIWNDFFWCDDKHLDDIKIMRNMLHVCILKIYDDGLYGDIHYLFWKCINKPSL